MLFLVVEHFRNKKAKPVYERARGVRFIEKPRDESYGKVAVFEDLYGSRWDLVERR